ncbi:probable G-protein coupled receptor 139 [Scyliorhinus torazame]|uniref:probable G-protein coupled receptor 139 n=1 Tax=Scyliorhinus torazame TaxID=75743 RepID=UPI003B5B33E4
MKRKEANEEEKVKERAATVEGKDKQRDFELRIMNLQIDYKLKKITTEASSEEGRTPLCQKPQVKMFAYIHELPTVDDKDVEKRLLSRCEISQIPLNLVSILILSRGKCSLSTCTTCYLVAMATADLLVIITEVILNRINDYYFPLNFLRITPVCSVRYVLLRIATDCSVWFTVAFTFDRFVVICCQKLKSKYCTKRTAAVVLAIIDILFTVKNIPIYFRFKPRRIIDNVPWMCLNKRSYFTDPVWIGFRKFEKVLTPLIPFALILLLNVLTVRHILVTSRVRKQLRGQSVGDNHSDPEMESRRKSMILLFSISCSFILLWFVYVLYFFDVNDLFDADSFYIFENVAYMLRNLSCCTNTLIYVLTQSNFREQLKSMLKYPVISIIKLINKQHI